MMKNRVNGIQKENVQLEFKKAATDPTDFSKFLCFYSRLLLSTVRSFLAVWRVVTQSEEALSEVLHYYFICQLFCEQFPPPPVLCIPILAHILSVEFVEIDLSSASFLCSHMRKEVERSR